MFPVSGVDFLGDSTKTVKSAWFTNAADLILDSVEVDHIAVHTMGVLHVEMIELVLGIGNGVVWTERGLELYDELTPAGHPQGTCIRIIHSQ